MKSPLPCKEVLADLAQFVDDELPSTRRTAIKEHLDQCTNCLAAAKKLQVLRQALQKEARHAAPSTLAAQVREGLVTKPAPPAARPAGRRRRFGKRLWAAFAAASMLLAVGTGVVVWVLYRGPSAQNLVAQEVVASHVRSLMVDHITDVESSDRHELKPWFSGKLDFSPRVLALDAKSYPLVGARLDYLQRRSVAVLVYQHREHTINLYVWPSHKARKADLENLSHHGYRLFHWIDDGLVHWAVSDLGATELRTFVKLLRQS